MPFVTKHLKSDVVLIDTARTIEKCELSYSYDGKEMSIVYDGKPITGIRSVWYRRPYTPEREDLKVPAAYKDYAYSAVRKHIHDLYSMLQGTFWLTDYYTLVKAESKPRQIELAAHLGFTIPKTLSTNNASTAEAFLKDVGDAVVKSNASTLPVIDGKVQYFYTTRIKAGEKLDMKGLHLGPSIFQEAIDVDKGLRVTVVGNEVFAAAIKDPQYADQPGIVDWRRAYVDADHETRFEAYSLPADLEAKCIALTHALGLRFGAIDIMLDKKGEYWFLEINPNGQWAFIEEDTGQLIGKAIANLLETQGGRR